MAISGSAIWEVRTAGSDNNGGGFVSGGTDFSQQNAAQVAIDNSAIVCSTPAANSNTLTFVSGYTPSAADVGNIVQILTGTNINAGFFQITAQTSTTWTLSGASTLTTAGGAGSAITGNMGGALATPGMAGKGLTSGNDIYIQNGGSTYVITSSSGNVSGGCIGTGAAVVRVIGYATNRNAYNTDSPPTLQLQAGLSGATIINANGTSTVWNLILDGNSTTTSKGISKAAAWFCTFKNLTNGGVTTGSAHNCLFTGCSTVTPCSSPAYACVGTANTVTSFSSNTVDCIAFANTGASTDGFSLVVDSGLCVNCVAYGNGRDGFSFAGGNGFNLSNCISVLNSRYGFNAGTGPVELKRMVNCASYGNTSGDNPASLPGWTMMLAITADPFVAGGSGNFALNNTAGAGAVLRAASYPPSFLGAPSTTSYSDVGAAQHQDAGGGGTIFVECHNTVIREALSISSY